MKATRIYWTTWKEKVVSFQMKIAQGVTKIGNISRVIFQILSESNVFYKWEILNC